LADKSKNPYTDAILSVLSQYSFISKDSKKRQVPKVMAERQNDEHNPVTRWLRQHNIEDKDMQGFF